ncbi:MAG: serine protease [Pseudomonadota bacterium]
MVNASGDVLTNQHVVAKCSSLVIQSAGAAYPGVLRTQDSASDLAVVRAAGLPVKGVARFRVGRMRLGRSIVVVGYPLSTILGTDLKATTGNISGLSGLGNNTAFFQLTAPIQPGNSGSPVVDRTGAVVGIVTSKLKEIAAARKIGTLPQLINFGVKSRTARSFLKSGRVAFTVSRRTQESNTVGIVASASKYTVRVVCN